MAEHTRIVLATVLDEDTTLSPDELCRGAALEQRELLALVQEGVVEPAMGEDAAHWRFPATALRRVRTVVSLQRELDVNLAGAALALDLIDEVERLRARLHVLEQTLAR